MRQWVVAVVLGIAAGAAFGQPGGELVPLGADATVAQRADFYDSVARVRSAATLDALVSRVAALPPGDARRFQLDAIVERYVELDVERAVRISGQLLRADAPDLVRRVYERLGRTDVNAALAALSQIDDLGEERLAADALLEALGGDLRALELVSAALHGVDPDPFRASHLVRLGRESPREAFAAALELRDAAARSAAATGILAAWVVEAPEDAIDALRRVDDSLLGPALRDVMLRSLRTADSIFAYLGTLDEDEYRQALDGGVLARLAQTDPVAAAEIVAGMPVSDQRRRLEMQVGTAYGQKDPVAALAWARNLSADNPELVPAILRGVAFTDPLRAFDLAVSLDEPTRSQGVLMVLGTGGDRPFAALANRVLRLPEGQTRTAAVMSVLSSWAMGPDKKVEALDWALANANAVPPEAFERLAYQVAQADPTAAAAYLDRVPSAGRAGWLRAVAVSYAATGDPQAALSFLERYRGDPGFDRAATALAPHLARTDPPAAARLLGSVSERSNEGFGAELQIAREWAQRDPAAAAAWAIDLPLMQRNAIVGMVAGAWALADRDAVRRWALSMPSGEKRDAVLAAAVRASGTEPDAALMGAFSDDRARQAAMMAVVLNAATTDRDAARRLLAAYISDPKMRAQAEQMIDTMPRSTAGMPNAGFGVPAGIVVRDPVTGTFIGGGPTGLAPGAPAMAFPPGGAPPPGLVVGPNGPVFMPAPPGPGSPAGQTVIRAPVAPPPTAPVPTR